MEPNRYGLLATALIVVGGIWFLGMESVHRIYNLYEFTYSKRTLDACSDAQEAVQFVQGVVWIASITTLLGFAWVERVLRDR